MKTTRALFLLLNILLVTTMNTTPLTAEELAPHLHKATLDNGLTVLVRETPGTRVATVQIWVKAGSVYENTDEAGITHFIEHMIFKGTWRSRCWPRRLCTRCLTRWRWNAR